MDQTLQLGIPLVLPGVKDERDQCVARLKEEVTKYDGIEEAQVSLQDRQALLRLRYDPNVISVEQVQRIAERAGAQIARQYQHEVLSVSGMDCTDCSVSVEHIVSRLPGIIDVSVNYAGEKMRVEYDATRITRDGIVRRVRWMGYEVVEEERARGWVQENWELALSLLAGFFLATGFFGERFLAIPTPAVVGFYALAYVAGGYDITRHGLKSLLNLSLDIDVLMVLGAAGAAVLGEWLEGALLLFLFSLGHALEHYATGKARRAIKALGEISPKTARVRRDGREMELPVDEVQRGDMAIVRPGERLPVDGKIVKGHSAIDQSPITGESVPVEKQEGDDVFAGSVNGEGALEIEVTKLARDTTLARVVRMVEEAEAQKSPTQRLVERFERIFVPAALVGMVAVIVIPPLLGWLSWPSAFFRGIALLVASAPCALAIATPSAVLSGVARAAWNGVLIKGGVHLENLGAVSAIAFDKTGTITRGKPEVTDVIPLGGTEQRELLLVTAAVESRSSHPLALAIVRHAQAQGLELPTAGELHSITGRGVRAEFGGRVVRIGNLTLFTVEDGRPVPDAVVQQVNALEADGKTTMIVKVDDRFLGIIALRDQPRPEARATMDELRRLGVESLIMVTGDNERVAAAIAREVGLTAYRANLLPEQKVDAVRELLGQYGQVAMVGDGVNDAPALAAATVGIAMGAGGTDVALETANVALMADDLSKLPFVVALSRHSRGTIQQNLFISWGVIALLVPAALSGIAGIALAVLFHEGSTLVVVANALRLLRFK
ncbi:MAG: heavy metal translocating P-type ATPase [Dehalococcoidales bacterium]|nr:heavy metal translocating P-type ATPase [Dehalococcoidales bacterium]